MVACAGRDGKIGSHSARIAIDGAIDGAIGGALRTSR